MALSETAQLALINRRNAWRLIPFVMMGYVLNTIDKSNVGFAALEMNKALGFTAAIYGLGAGLFFMTYTLFQIPSNLFLARWGSRLCLGGILVVWGLAAAAQALITDQTSFFTIRLLLGAAEAGWFPGVLFFMCSWFPRDFRARAMAYFVLGAPLAAVIGFPLSGWILELPTYFGLSSWQSLFILEGLPTVILGLAAIIWLRDKPEDSGWLTQEQKALLAKTLASESRVDVFHKLGRGEAVAILLHPLVLFYVAVNFLYGMNFWGILFWLPGIVRALGTLSFTHVGMLSAIPFLCAAIGLYACATSSDRLKERKWHISAMFALSAVGMLTAGLASSPVLNLIGISLAVGGSQGQVSTLYAMMTEGFQRISATPAILGSRIALIIMAGSLGGFAATYGFGVLLELTGGFEAALMTIAGLLALAGLLVACATRSFLEPPLAVKMVPARDDRVLTPASTGSLR